MKHLLWLGQLAGGYRTSRSASCLPASPELAGRPACHHAARISLLATFDGTAKSSLRTPLPTKSVQYPAEKVGPISSLQLMAFLMKPCRRLDLEREQLVFRLDRSLPDNNLISTLVPLPSRHGTSLPMRLNRCPRMRCATSSAPCLWLPTTVSYVPSKSHVQSENDYRYSISSGHGNEIPVAN